MEPLEIARACHGIFLTPSVHVAGTLIHFDTVREPWVVRAAT